MQDAEVVAEEVDGLLPICETNRHTVVQPNIYASNVVFKIGPLTLIDRAP
ncbi:MAG: hypothetical protein JRN39_06840 [Nitrososphaerota archaeon]|nr:hypothetical protein [Nitrososphaerota archaeon]MDG6940099.1 hypothetical protein [Nitrososphaerota archaeon]